MLFTDHFVAIECYDEFSVDAMIHKSVTALHPEERLLVAEYLKRLLHEKDDVLFAAWDKANGQLSPAQESQRVFSEMALKSLVDTTLPFISENRIIYTEEA